MVATNHTYKDMFDPDDKISGGQGYLCIKYCCCNEKTKTEGRR